MSSCTSLNTINLNLPELTAIGEYFMNGCIGLTTINFNLPKLTKIGNEFLSDNIDLITIICTCKQKELLIRYPIKLESLYIK